MTVKELKEFLSVLSDDIPIRYVSESPIIRTKPLTRLMMFIALEATTPVFRHLCI